MSYNNIEKIFYFIVFTLILCVTINYIWKLKSYDEYSYVELVNTIVIVIILVFVGLFVLGRAMEQRSKIYLK